MGIDKIILPNLAILEIVKRLKKTIEQPQLQIQLDVEDCCLDKQQEIIEQPSTIILNIIGND